ncbi:MAG: shikimate dehydrogenase [Bacteroidota bacterium]|nr:shikimate dehydrogenase [Bacteroidota bacterium]
MKNFGLIGKSLSHSFSKSYFETKFSNLGLKNYTYKNFELLDIKQIQSIFSSEKLNGLNVTNPYKEEIIPFLDELSSEAEEIGAVNCVKISNGKKVGYNTDTYGFSQSIKPFLEPQHNKALILGTGGASKAVAHALKRVGVEVFFATSSSTKKTANTFFYSELNNYIIDSFKLIVNTTPLGLFPNINQQPEIPYEYISANHLCYDLIYNPEKTLFLNQASQQGASIINGYSMLQLQAEKSWKIWNEN